MDPYIIGFGHRARSGKDTAAATIIEHRGTDSLGLDIRRYSFADELKREVTQAALSAGGMRELFGTWEFVQENGNFIEFPEWVRESYEENPDMSDPLCPFGKQRGLLQFWGTELRRSVNPNYWVDKLSKNIVKDKPDVALIADVRFPNEMLFVTDCKGDTVRIDRSVLPKLSNTSHPSETALAGIPDEYWSRVLTNDGTLEEFQAKVLEMFDTFMDFRVPASADATGFPYP
jgi:hypothetical protein